MERACKEIEGLYYGFRASANVEEQSQERLLYVYGRGAPPSWVLHKCSF
jgi:hypothetical protein